MSALAGPLCCLNVLNVMNANTIFMVGETENRVRDGTEALAGDGDGDGNGAGPVLEPLVLALSPPAWDFWSRRWTGRDAYIAGGTPEGAVFARLNQVGRQN